MSRTTSGAQPTTFDQSRIAATTDKSPIAWKGVFTILKQVYRAIAHTVQGAFKDLMTHRFMQIALLFAFHCVLHRCKSQEIHC